MLRLFSSLSLFRSRADASAILPSDLPDAELRSLLPWTIDPERNFPLRMCIYLGRRHRRRAATAGILALGVVAASLLFSASLSRAVVAILLACCAAWLAQLLAPALVIRSLFGAAGKPRTDLWLSLASSQEIAVALICWSLSRRNLQLLRLVAVVAVTVAYGFILLSDVSPFAFYLMTSYLGAIASLRRYAHSASRIAIASCISSLAHPSALLHILQPRHSGRRGWSFSPQFLILAAATALSLPMAIATLGWFAELALIGAALAALFSALHVGDKETALNDLIRSAYLLEGMIRQRRDQYDDERPGGRIPTLRGSRIDCDSADWSGLAVPRSDLRNLNLRYATLARAYLRGSDFSLANLAGAVCVEANLAGCTFKGAVLDRASFAGATLADANFTDCILREVDFSGANLKGASFENARIYNCRFAGAQLHIAPFYGSFLERVDLSAASGLEVRQISYAELGKEVTLPSGINPAAIAAFQRRLAQENSS